MMKKLFALALCAALLCCAVVMPAMAASTMYIYADNGKGVNLRSEPDSTVKNVIAVIPFGAAVTVNDQVGMPAGWANVTYNGLSGYMMTDYLSATKLPKRTITIDESPKSSNDLVSMFRGFVQVTPYTGTLRPNNSPNALMRWAPTKEAGVLVKYVPGQTVTVIAESNYWVQARDEATGKVGFIWKPFVQR